MHAKDAIGTEQNVTL